MGVAVVGRYSFGQFTSCKTRRKAVTTVSDTATACTESVATLVTIPLMELKLRGIHGASPTITHSTSEREPKRELNLSRQVTLAANFAEYVGCDVAKITVWGTELSAVKCIEEL